MDSTRKIDSNARFRADDDRNDRSFRCLCLADIVADELTAWLNRFKPFFTYTAAMCLACVLVLASVQVNRQFSIPGAYTTAPASSYSEITGADGKPVYVDKGDNNVHMSTVLEAASKAIPLDDPKAIIFERDK